MTSPVKLSILPTTKASLSIFIAPPFIATIAKPYCYFSEPNSIEEPDMLSITDDIRIDNLRPLISPALLMEELPHTNTISEVVVENRKAIEQCIGELDHRLVAVVGPCSIHCPESALEYAEKLKALSNRLADDLIIIMRVYFEKPRTTVGWKGLINDPHLDGSFDINRGLRMARKVLSDINHLGMACGTEFLDTIVPQYISDLVAWGAIGARTTESQVHRELASGLSMPIGFKNGTNGSIQIAVDAIGASKNPHHFLSVTKHGIAAIVSTRGNEFCHVILRGGAEGPNYDATAIKATKEKLHKAGLPDKVMVDCSHGNSQKDHTRQQIVVESLCEQIAQGEKAIFGLMLESHLKAGNQKLTHKEGLTYGQSITDACIDFSQTEALLEQLAKANAKRKGR